MESIKNFESFFRCHFMIGFVVLCLFLIYRRKYLIGILGFSDHSINYMQEPKLEEEIVRKKEEKSYKGPKNNELRVGFFVPTETGFMN